MKRKKRATVQHIYCNCTFSTISATHGSTVLQGNTGLEAAINGGMIGDVHLNEQEREMLRLFRLFSIRQQTSEMLRWYELAEERKGASPDAEKE